MLSAIIKWAIARRWLVILGAIIVTIWIFRTIIQMPLDVFPSFAPPQVEIQTETPGLAPEEVESLVTLPIESSINGTPGVTEVRSSSHQLSPLPSLNGLTHHHVGFTYGAFRLVIFSWYPHTITEKRRRAESRPTDIPPFAGFH